MKRNLFLFTIFILVCLFISSFKGPRDENKVAKIEAASTKAPSQNQISASEKDSNPQEKSRDVAAVPPNSIFDRKALQAKYPGEWVFHEDGQHRIRSMMGGIIPKGVADLQAAQATVAELAPLLGLKSSDLRPRSLKAQETPKSRIYHFDQVLGDHLVYQGGLTLIGRQEGGDLYMLNSTIKDVRYDGQPAVVSAKQSQHLLESDPTLKASHVSLSSKQNVLYEISPGSSELAWVFTAELSNPSQQGSFEIVVSAVTGKVLYRESRSMK